MLNTSKRPLRRVALLCLAILVCAGVATAQSFPTLPASSQFDITGFLQTATVNTPGSPLSGGTLTVNGHTVTVPDNTIVILPANALTWQELFAKAPAPYTGVATGMAMYDSPPPLTTYEVHVVGNVVGGQYIAGLIDIAQNGLNAGAGYINFIDYATGEIRVGGILGSSTTGTRVRINDPLGRYGRVYSPDVRFTVDPDNPTISAGTGYPMCIPRTDPAGATPDLLCPEGNRPLIPDAVTGLPVPAISITTNNASNPLFPIIPGYPDSHFQAPMEIGDYITFSGMLVKDCPVATCPSGATTAGPLLATDTTFIAADTIGNNAAIYTWDGSNPAYITIEVGLIGTGGLTVLGAGEAAIRSRWEGMTTDKSRNVNLYGMDWDSTGAETDRYYGTIGVDQGPAGGVGAVQGRWRFRPPCLPFGSVPTKPDKECVMNQAGTFLPPTREVRAVIAGLETQVATPVLSANGLIFGQYHAPLDEYIFPENIPGTPIVENNFNAIPFLACGGYSSSGIDFVPTAPTLAPGPLNPWPSNVPPNTSACAGFVAAPSGVIASANPSTVISGAGTTVTLSATASGTAPLTFSWAQAPTDVPQVALTNGGTATATFTAPTVAATTTLNFTVTVTNSAGSASAPVTVSVVVGTPVVNHIAPITVFSGISVTLTASAVDPTGSKVQFSWQQLSGAPTVLNPNPSAFTGFVNSGQTATGPSFTVTLPAGAPGTTLGFEVVAKNQAGVQSLPEFFTVTINPQADTVTVTAAEYRTGKQRLDLTVSSNVVSPLVSMTLQPYLCQGGATTACPGGFFDPATVGGAALTNTGGGIYTLTLVGAPAPACNPPNPGGAYTTPCSQRPIIVKSSLNGQSAPTALTRIRQ